MTPGPRRLGCGDVIAAAMAARRRPSARCGTRRRMSAISALSKPVGASRRCRHSTPQQCPAAISAARSSSPSPSGAITSKYRGLILRSSDVARSSELTWSGATASSVNLSTSSRPNSLSRNSERASNNGSSVNTEVYSIVAGSTVAKNAASIGTIRRRPRSISSRNAAASSPR